MRRTRTVLAIATLLGVAAIAATLLLQQHADASRSAQLQLQHMKLALSEIQTAPFRASPEIGGSPEQARSLITQGHEEISRSLGALSQQSPPGAISSLPPLLRENDAFIERIFELGTTGAGDRAEAVRLILENSRRMAEVDELLVEASREYDARATRADRQAAAGGAAAILVLLAAFAYYYLRSARTAGENRRLLAQTRLESLTDALTGLHNRRALMEGLAEGMKGASDARPLLLTLFDLDGFKQYNDSYGHPAGDVLLARLAGRLQQATAGIGSVYRMGGDEFCLLASLEPGDEPEALGRLGSAALSEAGEGFEIGCSYGSALAPADTSRPEQMLHLADQRMYSTKAGRSSASRQSTDVLLQVLSERNSELGDHLNAVAAMAEPVARRFGLSAAEVNRTQTAAQLHDVGKSGIPDAILGKKGPLDEEEWKFMHRHTLIGERIILAAPSLAPAAELVRSSHERYDGEGYPDHLAGDEIPPGSRIIAVCDAFQAMTAERPYRGAISVAEALAELRRCAGTQFDPVVVDEVCAQVEERQATSNGSGAPSPLALRT